MANTFWHVQIDDIFITSTGDENGRWCKCLIPNADNFFQKRIGNTTNGASGVPFNESPLILPGVGEILEITMPNVQTSVFTELQNFMDDLATDGDETTIIAAGEPGAINVDGIAHLNKNYFSFGEFTDGEIRNVVCRFAVTVNNLL